MPIWTAREVLILWVFSIRWAAMAWSAQNWPWPLAIALPIIHEVHFYLICRTIHVSVPNKWIHSIHHRSVNPSPWSSLSLQLARRH